MFTFIELLDLPEFGKKLQTTNTGEGRKTQALILYVLCRNLALSEKV